MRYMVHMYKHATVTHLPPLSVTLWLAGLDPCGIPQPADHIEHPYAAVFTHAEVGHQLIGSAAETKHTG